jgi:hypothetical protein
MDPVSSANHDALTDCKVSVYTGNEPFFSFFSTAEVALATVRLTLADRCLYQASDLGSQLVTLRREFQHDGKFTDALQDLMRITNQFQIRVQSWEREVQNLERSKLEMAGARLQRIRVEVSQVRGKVQMTDRVLSKLQIILHQLQAEESERLLNESKATSSVPADPGDQEEAESVFAQFQEAIEAFIGRELVVDAARAVSESQGPGLRVQTWDQPIFLAVAQWRVDDSTVSDSDRRLTLWLIPKFKDIATFAAWIARSLRLDFLDCGTHKRIEFQPACPLPVENSTSLTPAAPTLPKDAGINFLQSSSVVQELDRLIARRFDRERNQLIALAAEIPLSDSKEGKVIIKTSSREFHDSSNPTS